jgi:alkanesulfonate monooxygenase SsuD/methylene tetrahydromethanopterin reductase-like flavin-dependent oxidoreductase (luciferase family)
MMNVPFGINFFSSVRPEQKSGEQYFDEALRLSVLADRLGYSHVRTVEHYFRPYGGMTPSPIVFLSAVAARTERIRLVTGAVIPIFNHPIKLAGETAMLDAISRGRLDVGFARAFLPEEFDAFERSMGESRRRYEHGIEAVVKLWTEEEVTHHDPFYRFGPIISSPRPVHQPHPPVFIAAIGTPQSFEWAGRQGHGLMIVPYLSKFADVQRNVRLYRETFAAHPARPAARVRSRCRSTSTSPRLMRRPGRRLRSRYRSTSRCSGRVPRPGRAARRRRTPATRRSSASWTA